MGFVENFNSLANGAKIMKINMW